MLVEMWMTRDPFTIAPTATVSEAALVMAHRRVRRLVVVAGGRADGRVVGIVSAGDVARAFPPDLNPASAAVSERSVATLVASIMTTSVVTVPPSAAIEEAARLLRERKIGALQVVSGHRLVGIVTESDLFRALVEMSDPSEPGVRITFELAEDEDALAAMLETCAAYPVRIGSVFSFHHRDARTGERRRLGVVRLAGEVPDALVDAIWRSRHRVLAVVAREPAEPRRQGGVTVTVASPPVAVDVSSGG